MNTEKSEILKKAWEKRCKLRRKGNKLCLKSRKFYSKDGRETYAKGEKLRVECNKLWNEGDALWANCILEVCGNIKIKWNNRSIDNFDSECHLETGEIFKP